MRPRLSASILCAYTSFFLYSCDEYAIAFTYNSAFCYNKIDIPKISSVNLYFIEMSSWKIYLYNNTLKTLIAVYILKIMICVHIIILCNITNWSYTFNSWQKYIIINEYYIIIKIPNKNQNQRYNIIYDERLNSSLLIYLLWLYLFF